MREDEMRGTPDTSEQVEDRAGSDTRATLREKLIPQVARIAAKGDEAQMAVLVKQYSELSDYDLIKVSQDVVFEDKRWQDKHDDQIVDELLTGGNFELLTGGNFFAPQPTDFFSARWKADLLELPVQAPKEIDAPADPTVRFEDLSPAAVKGLDNFRAWMRAAKLKVVYDECQFWVKNDGSCWDLPGIVHGFVLSAGATFEESVKAMQFAGRRQHNYWMEGTAHSEPPTPDMVKWSETLGTEAQPRTVTTWKFVG